MELTLQVLKMETRQSKAARAKAVVVGSPEKKSHWSKRRHFRVGYRETKYLKETASGRVTRTEKCTVIDSNFSDR